MISVFVLDLAVEVCGPSKISGGFKDIFQGFCLPINDIPRRTQCAIAKPKHNRYKPREAARKEMQREVEMWKLVEGHPLILKLYRFVDDPLDPMIAMELVDPISFDLMGYAQHHYKYSTPPIEEVAGFFVQLIAAVRHMHEKRVLHRDIHSGQVLVRGKEIRLIDFGWAATFEEVETNPTLKCPKLTQSAPEMKEYRPKYGVKVDAYGLGFILTEIYPEAYVRNGRIRDLPLDMVLAREGLTCKDPNHRWSLDELASCDWMKTVEERDGGDVYLLSISAPNESASEFKASATKFD